MRLTAVIPSVNTSNHIPKLLIKTPSYKDMFESADIFIFRFYLSSRGSISQFSDNFSALNHKSRVSPYPIDTLYKTQIAYFYVMSNFKLIVSIW